MDVKFETHMGRKFTMEVGFFDTVLDLKKKIEKYEGFDCTKIALFFDQEQEQMKDSDNIIDSYCVTEGSTLRLRVDDEKPVTEKPPAEISVQVIVAPEKKFVFKVDVKETVGYLKERIEHKLGIPRDRCALWYDGIELLDLRVIDEYPINDGSEFRVVFANQIE